MPPYQNVVEFTKDVEKSGRDLAGKVASMTEDDPGVASEKSSGNAPG